MEIIVVKVNGFFCRGGFLLSKNSLSLFTMNPTKYILDPKCGYKWGGLGKIQGELGNQYFKKKEWVDRVQKWKSFHVGPSGQDISFSNRVTTTRHSGTFTYSIHGWKYTFRDLGAKSQKVPRKITNDHHPFQFYLVLFSQHSRSKRHVSLGISSISQPSTHCKKHCLKEI